TFPFDHIYRVPVQLQMKAWQSGCIQGLLFGHIKGGYSSGRQWKRVGTSYGCRGGYVGAKLDVKKTLTYDAQKVKSTDV
ncbi:hypothetical protein SK128_003570, partial [Halocaridina rubra]